MTTLIALHRSRTRARPLLAVVVMALIATLTACGGSSSGAGSSDAGVLKIAMTASNIPLTDTYPDNGYEGFRFVGLNLYDGLTRLNLDQADSLPTPQPGLAESWSHSADLTQWTFKLRQDVRFQDGTPFNADAVIFNIRRMKDPSFEYFNQGLSARAAAAFKYYKSWSKVDDYTIEIDTTQPYAYLPYDTLTLLIASPTAIQKEGNDKYALHPVGTGPFQMTSLVDGQVLKMQANPNYWRGPSKLKEIDLYPAPEAATRLAMLQSGQVNWAEAPAPDSIDSLKRDNFQVELAKYPHGIMPRFNMFSETFKNNLALRQALNYAIDRDGTAALINKAGYGADQYVYKGHPDYIPNYAGYGYDVGKAKSLLAQAGYQPGQLTLTMAYPTGGSGNMYPDVMMQKLQADFKAIGVTLKLQPMEWNTLITVGIDGLNKPQWSNIDILWASPAAGMLPTGYTSAFVCNRAPGTPNAAGLCDPVVDAAINAAMATDDQAQQHQDIQAALKQTEEQAYFLYWMHDLNLRVLPPDVKGYVQVQSWWLDFTRYTVG